MYRAFGGPGAGPAHSGRNNLPGTVFSYKPDLEPYTTICGTPPWRMKYQQGMIPLQAEVPDSDMNIAARTNRNFPDIHGKIFCQVRREVAFRLLGSFTEKAAYNFPDMFRCLCRSFRQANHGRVSLHRLRRFFCLPLDRWGFEFSISFGLIVGRGRGSSRYFPAAASGNK